MRTDQMEIYDRKAPFNNLEYRLEFLDIHQNDVKKYLTQYTDWKSYEKHIHDFKGEIVIDKNTDKLVGLVLIYDKKYKGFITPLYVVESYRNLGIGTKLLDDAIKKYSAIDLVVSANNTNAISLYLQNGFVPIGYGDRGKPEYHMKLKSKLTRNDRVINIK